MLLRSGFTVKWAEGFVGAVATATGDDEVTKRVRCVADTHAKFDNGDQVTGWGSGLNGGIPLPLTG